MNKKVIVCDLDGTLTKSKSPLESDMAYVICKVLLNHKMAIISGASFDQFQKQFLSNLHCDGGLLKNLYIFPTNGSSFFSYEENSGEWKEVYKELLDGAGVEKIISALKGSLIEVDIDSEEIFGEQIENRGSQITFSGLGSTAPLERKKVWDPDQEKRKKIVSALKKKIPEFEIKIGGTTSIDITKKGIDKAYAIEKIEKYLNVKKEEILFLGDAIFPGGNDFSAKMTGVECISVNGPEEATKVLLLYTT